MEKDPHDTTQKAKESQDTSHKILELQKKLDSARAQVINILYFMLYSIMIFYSCNARLYVVSIFKYIYIHILS